MLVGTWINTQDASTMDPDLGGASSPVRIKAIHVGDGNYLRRSGTSPWTDNRPSEDATHKVWVRLRISEDGRVRYEQIDFKGAYFVLEFPVNAPWQREEQVSHEFETTNEEDREHDVSEGEHLDEIRQEAKDNFELQPSSAVSAGVMEYVNGFGETKARISYEYRPRGWNRSRHSRSRLRITPDLVGRSYTLFRERRVSS
jgi:hypothetical protein